MPLKFTLFVAKQLPSIFNKSYVVSSILSKNSFAKNLLSAGDFVFVWQHGRPSQKQEFPG